ncbi:hypothetical protein [Streptomyces sp. NPDC051109]|uniref:hypothetical protein n=1 Tax=Streptomyces sp. NPDC051109 TaxID=3365642 RepID=UPI0037ACE15A
MTLYDPDAIVWTLGVLVLIVPVLIVAIRQSGATARTTAQLAREREYQRLAELALATQELTEHELGEITVRLEEIRTRVTSVERSLKEIE